MSRRARSAPEATEPVGSSTSADAAPSAPRGRRGRARGEAVAAWRNRMTGSGIEDPRQLLANPSNYRRHPPEQRAALRGSLSTIGWVQQVVVNTVTGHMVDGHARVEEALARLEPGVPVLYIERTPEEEALVLASLDPIGAMATVERDALATLLAGLEPEDDGLARMLAELAGWNGILSAGLGNPDAAPDLPPEADLYVRAGELWRLDRHRLLCADATLPENVDRLFAGETATLMATDPPYLVDYQGGNHPQSWHNRAGVKDKHWDDYLDPAASVAFFTAFLAAALPHLAPNVAIYQWHAHRRQALVEAAWAACGLLVHQQLIWAKARAVLTHSHYMWSHEPCFYGWVEGAPPDLKPPANERTVWQVDQQGEADGIHPTQKPVELFARPIAYHTRPGEICFDPFLGSGTALIAAEQAGRRCYALEIEPRYVQVAIERWQAFTGKTAERVDG